MGWKELIVIILVIAIISAVIALTLAGDSEQAKKLIHTVILILVILLLVYIIYEIYEYYQKIKKNEPLLFDGPASGKVAHHYPHTMLPPSRIGAEYTYSFWLYIKNWDYNYDKAKHILSRGSDPSHPKYGETFVCNPGIWLYPKSSNLMIRFDTYGREPSYSYLPGSVLSGQAPAGGTSIYQDTTIKGCQTKCNEMDTCAGISVHCQNKQCILKDSPYSSGKTSKSCKVSTDCGENQVCKSGLCQSIYDSYVKTTSMDPNLGEVSSSDQNEICDLVNLPIQRWVHVGVVLWNRTTDIYLNGKLVRSCILKGVPKIPSTKGLYVANNGGFDGSIAQLRYYNRSLNATEMYKLYSKGPLHWNLLKEFKDLFPKIQISTSVSVDSGEQ